MVAQKTSNACPLNTILTEERSPEDTDDRRKTHLKERERRQEGKYCLIGSLPCLFARHCSPQNREIERVGQGEMQRKRDR